MYNIIIEDAKYIIDSLNNANKNIDDSIQTSEKANYIKYIYQETKNNDLKQYGVKINTIQEIEQIFKEYFTVNILTIADDMLYFSQALRNYDIEDSDFKDDSTLISVTGFNDEIFTFKIKSSCFDDSEGGQSYVVLEINNDNCVESRTMYYNNSSSELDEDTNTYIPSTEGEIDDSEIVSYDKKIGKENFIITELENFINQQPSNKAMEDFNSDD